MLKNKITTKVLAVTEYDTDIERNIYLDKPTIYNTIKNKRR